MARVTSEEWAKRIERWAESGLTGAEFASEIGVKEATLRHWKWKLARSALDPQWEAKGARARRRRRPEFVEVTAPTTPGIASTELLEITLRNGLQVRLPVEIDPERLRRFLDVLETR